MKYITPIIDKKAITEMFLKELEGVKTNSGKLNFTYNFNEPPKDTEKPIVIISETAKLKMDALVDETDSEIGWHGVVHKTQNVYTITDVLVYPQTVTSVTVDTDETEYGNWLIGFEDDVFNNIRMQGHSHVRMGTTPSGTDTAMYEAILKGLRKNDYYIFIIANKNRDLNIMLYDYSQNIIFEKADITVINIVNGESLDKWVTEAKSNIKNKTYSYSYRGAATTTVCTSTTTAKDTKEKKPKKDKKSKKDDYYSVEELRRMNKQYDSVIGMNESPLSDMSIDEYYDHIYGGRY